MEVLVGTSGWQYKDWRERFYPRGLPTREWLGYFSERFPVVEVNNTFYRLPEAERFATWRRGSAEDFLFVIKASRYITHIRRLRDCRDAVRMLWPRCRRLGRKLGPVLFQLPPNLKTDAGLLRDFIDVLPPTMRPAFEFRHDSWRDDRIHDLLDGAGCALVLPDRPGFRVPDLVTGGWGYVRFHQGQRLRPDYSRSKLRRFADRIAGMDAREVFVFFNNDPGGAAVRDAVTLTELLEERDVSVRSPRPAER